MPLTGADVEQAFVAAAHAQENGEPFNWPRLAELLNRKVADRRRERPVAFILGRPS